MRRGAKDAEPLSWSSLAATTQCTQLAEENSHKESVLSYLELSNTKYTLVVCEDSTRVVQLLSSVVIYPSNVCLFC